MISINKINIKTYQPRTAIGLGDGTTSFFWDVNGNLAQILNCSNGWSRRLHEWDEENRLRFVLGENTSAYYCYDANGERVYKLLGGNSFHQNIINTVSADVRIDDAVLYPNPYVVVTPQGYTKHYYAGTERLATAIGQGGLDTMIHPIDSLTQQDINEYHKPFHEYYSRRHPFRYHHTIGDVITTETIDGQQINKLQYQCSPLELDRMDVLLSSRNIVLLPMTYYSQNRGIENKIFFYHGDHLGSAHWITDSSSVPIQYIHYAPYGELIVNQKPYTYDERYKFTGKERDSETGYDYFGARYYWSTLGIFTQSDPLAGKYPWITSYAYCANNPVKYVDPDGKWIHAVVGGVVAGAADAVMQIGLNMYVNNQSFTESVKNIKMESVIASALTGAIGIGIVSKISQAAKIFKFGKASTTIAKNLASPLGDAVGSVVSQAIVDGEISADQVKADVIGGLIGNAAGTLTRNALKNSSGYKVALHQLDHNERVANGSTRLSRLQAVEKAQDKVENFGVTKSQTVSSGVSNIMSNTLKEFMHQNDDTK